MRVEVELMAIGVFDGALRWHCARRALGSGVPDALARALAGVGDGAAPSVALHSTSWRCDDGAVVLTYALFPAPVSRGAAALRQEHLAVGSGPLDPSPARPALDQVAAHAARHLADLAGGRDPHLTACAQALPGPWHALAAFAAGVHAHATRSPAGARTTPAALLAP